MTRKRTAQGPGVSTEDPVEMIKKHTFQVTLQRLVKDYDALLLQLAILEIYLYSRSIIATHYPNQTS